VSSPASPAPSLPPEEITLRVVPNRPDFTTSQPAIFLTDDVRRQIPRLPGDRQVEATSNPERLVRTVQESLGLMKILVSHQFEERSKLGSHFCGVELGSPIAPLNPRNRIEVTILAQ
jgi:hypothetical protein